ncbi:hypothetical protein CCACVL1_20140 [Corchorus capsularis]|uniref:Uncharacterized protein n=1 Tax=Corchorus capsularis TaxID=210143 RepID=A0A1R3HCE2_COCAP|nr:hypothetical protein CCACVL1_20140 [Corchorus capsularis]
MVTRCHRPQELEWRLAEVVILEASRVAQNAAEVEEGEVVSRRRDKENVGGIRHFDQAGRDLGGKGKQVVGKIDVVSSAPGCANHALLLNFVAEGSGETPSSRPAAVNFEDGGQRVLGRIIPGNGPPNVGSNLGLGNALDGSSRALSPCSQNDQVRNKRDSHNYSGMIINQLGVVKRTKEHEQVVVGSVDSFHGVFPAVRTTFMGAVGNLFPDAGGAGVDEGEGNHLADDEQETVRRELVLMLDRRRWSANTISAGSR